MPKIIHYEGLNLEFGEHPIDQGFDISLVTDDPAYTEDEGVLAKAEFSYGHILGYDEAKRIVEDDVNVLYIDTVDNYYAPPGTATKLMKFGLEEGRRRGFEMARAGIHNPRIVTIIEKLVAQGIAKERHYFNHHSPYDSTDDSEIEASTTELLRHREESTAQDAIHFLKSYEADEDGFVLDAVVFCVLEL